MSSYDKETEMIENGSATHGKNKDFVRVNSRATDGRSNLFHFDVSFEVKTKKVNKVILNHASDAIKSGEALAIMGPSGAGKTSLLKVLTGDALEGVSTGKSTLNGLPLTAERFSRKACLVAQEDFHWAFLTCKETLAFAADFYIPLSAHEKEQAVNTMMEKMGLESCADTIVGNVFVKGLSGGQKRRLSLGVALMKNVEIVFLDEPTSGLDAASSANIMSFLSEITKSEGLITIYTIHQPSTSIYNEFDRIMLLTEGRMAFCGARDDVLPYFESIQRPVPPQMNPAEFMLDLVNKDFVDASTVDDVLDKWDTVGVQQQKQRNQLLLSNLGSKDKVSDRVDGSTAGLISQSVTMLRRHGLLSIRDPILFTGRMVMFLTVTIFFAIIYVKSRDRNQEQALQRLWYIVWIIGVPSSMGVAAVFAYNTEFNAIKREVKNGMVSPLSYLLANSILTLPFMFLFAICAISVGAYGIINFNGENYGQYMLIYAITMYAYEAMAQLLAVSFSNPLMGMLNYMQLWFASFLFSGQFIVLADIVWPFRAFSFIFPMFYALRAMTYLEFIDKDVSGAILCNPQNVTGCLSHDGETGPDDGWMCPGADNDMVCYGREGWQVLDTIHKSFDAYSSDDTFVVDIAVMVAISAFCKIGYMAMLSIKANTSSKVTDEA